MKQPWDGLSRGLGWWISFGLVTRAGWIFGHWAVAGVPPTLYVGLLSLVMAELGIFGLIVLWRTRRSLREELTWVGIGIFALNGLIFLVIGVLFGNTMSYLVGCAILVGILFCGQLIASRNALHDFKKFKECPACLMPNMAMARCCPCGYQFEPESNKQAFQRLVERKRQVSQ